MSFATIPVRQNGQSVDATWWNLLRTAGISLEALVGAGSVKVITSADSPYSVDPATDAYIVADSSGGAVTVIAPSAAAFSGYGFKVKTKYNAVGAVTVTFADLCDNQASFTIPVNAAYQFNNDGTTYYAS